MNYFALRQKTHAGGHLFPITGGEIVSHYASTRKGFLFQIFEITKNNINGKFTYGYMLDHMR